MPENTVRFESSARVRARHALFAYDVADASPGRGPTRPGLRTCRTRGSDGYVYFVKSVFRV